MMTFEQIGIGGLFLKYSGDLLDTAQSLSSLVITPPVRTYMRFTAGITGLVKGATLTGQSSGAVIIVEGVVITSGTLAGSDAAGIIFLTVVSGTPQTDENFRISTTTYMVSRTTVITLTPLILEVKSVMIQCESAAVRLIWDDSTPTNSTETGDADFGWLVNPLDGIIVKGYKNVRNLKFLNAVAASNGVLNVVVQYGGAE